MYVRVRCQSKLRFKWDDYCDLEWFLFDRCVSSLSTPLDGFVFTSFYVPVVSDPNIGSRRRLSHTPEPFPSSTWPFRKNTSVSELKSTPHITNIPNPRVTVYVNDQKDVNRSYIRPIHCVSDSFIGHLAYRCTNIMDKTQTSMVGSPYENIYSVRDFRGITTFNLTLSWKSALTKFY